MKDLIRKNESIIEGKTAILSQEVTVLLLDNSASMTVSLKEFNSVSRFTAMKEAVTAYVKERIKQNKLGETDSVGVIAFDSNARILADPKYTTPEVALQAVLNMDPTGCTAMHKAFSLASSMCSEYEDSFIRLVLVSDGEPDSAEDVKNLVYMLYNELGIITDTIAITNNEFGFAANFLKEVAMLGGGSFTFISSAKQLKAKFLELEGERRALIGKGILLLGEG